MGEEILTFAELDRYATELAEHLRGDLTKEKPRVGICLTVTPWLPVAILGGLRAAEGIALIDPRWPAPLIESLLEETRCATLLCDSESATHFPDTTAVKRLVVDTGHGSLSDLQRPRIPGSQPRCLQSPGPA